jgi:hypothetical protein
MSQKPKYQGTIPFTFGVELEFDFAANNETAAGYFEDLVRKNPDSTLFRTEKNLRPKSNEMKALIRVAQILKQNGRSVQVLPHAKVAPDYTVWQITHDCTARIKAPNTLNTYLSDELKIPDNDFRSWKHEGLELVSPPLEVPLVASGSLQGGSLPEIEKYLRNQPKMPYRVVSDIPYTGFHVHVGIRPDDPEYSEISLKVLQHLSFLLIQYEDVISSFHPFSRRGPCNTALLDEVPISSMVDSKLYSFVELGHTCGQRTLTRSLTDIRDMIFAEDMTVKKLTELMDRESAAPQRTTRHKFVNFEPLNRRKRDLRTVEFRQHQGTLSPEDTRQWVSFLTALMRLAEQRAGVKLEQALTVPLIPTVVSSPSLERARELLNLLGLDVQARSYWLLRFDRYKTVPQEFSEMLEERPCPTCRKREGGGKFESGQTKREIDDGEGWQEVKNNKKNHHRRRI